MNHSYETIEQLAKRLCQESGGAWESRRKYWVRKAVARAELDERTKKMKSEYLYTWPYEDQGLKTMWWMFS